MPQIGIQSVHEAETYLNLWHQEANINDCIITELLRTTHTAYMCVPVTRWWMMKPSQNGMLLLQLHHYLQKGAIFGDRRGVKTLNYTNILAWEKFRSGKHLLDVTILYNCMHEILCTLNNETLQCLILWPHQTFLTWNHDITIWQSGVYSELWHNDGKQGAYILSLNSHCN
jgi:hypothetical protein